MHDIDFLPQQYRQKHANRQSNPWRVVVVVVFLLMIGAATLGLQSRRSAVEERLAGVAPQYELALAQSNMLSKIESELAVARQDANLITYLRHPWPRTQILNAVLTPLPDQVKLEELQIVCEKGAATGEVSRRSSRGEVNAEAEADAKLPPAERDLKYFRQEYDNSQTVVLLGGTTTDTAALHVYLGTLDRKSLFSKVELRSIESLNESRGGEMQFQAAVVVRPGYGQPGGPTPDERETLTRTASVTRP